MVTPQKLANAIRILSMDAVEKANSGHPGMPMGMADIAEVLWRDFLHHHPQNPGWPNRDRFVISNGHGSMLLYALLHLTGYDLSLNELENFRQLHSKTPGHPEVGITPGVETTTGPLGQGLANAVGMALAERTLASQFNRSSFPVINHYIYVFLGDGCLMEGISHEVCSLAGTLKLNKLIAFWDDNHISIDGEVQGWFTDDTPNRFRAYGWHVIPNIDGHDREAIKAAIEQAHQHTQAPILICCKTNIAHGAPKAAGTAKAHGTALGMEEIQATRENLNWTEAPFLISEDIYQAFDARTRGQHDEKDWNHLFQNYEQHYPELAKELKRRLSHALPQDFLKSYDEFITSCLQETKATATRKSSQLCLNALGTLLPELLGGSADLTDSNLTFHQQSQTLTSKKTSGNYIHYGVREFGMSAIMNGIALYGGFIPYGGTFLTFSDYARNAVRMAALMKQRVIFIYTHDSIGLGEDGPTHQPIEHAAALRLIPNLSVWRPADLVETAVAWKEAILLKHRPTALLLSRQNLPCLKRDENAVQDISKGGYVIRDSEQSPQLIIMATGSELQLAIQAYDTLIEKNIPVRVVSMPSTTTFDHQTLEYKESVLPSHVKHRLAIEAGKSDFWYKYVGLEGKIIGIDTFGESGKAEDLFIFFKFTLEHVLEVVEEWISQ